MITPWPSTWALILAGGDGARLRPLTTRIVGDARPKQFCPLLDGETLLQRTRRRADLVARFDHQVVVVTRTHAPFYRDLALDLAPGRLVVQPVNRGTYVRSAVAVAREHPGRVVLLGIEPDHPESEYGWIEPGEVLDPDGSEPAFRIERFWEKPSVALATRLLAHGCLWNSFVMVGYVDAFLELVRRALPDLVAAFESIRPALGRPQEDQAVQALYAGLPSLGFSDSILAAGTMRLATVRVKGVGWSDWGNPARVVASLRRAGREPEWARYVELASTA